MGILNNRTGVTTLGGAAVLAVLTVGSSWIFSGDQPPAVSAAFAPYTRVTQGPFEIRVTAPALLDASQSVTLSSELPSNKAKLLYLATEGSLLQAGDVVARFDRSPFEDEVLRLQGEIEELRATLMQARAEEALQQQDARARRAEIDYQVVLAGLRRAQLKKVEQPAREQLARKELARTQAEHKRLLRERDTQRQLVAQGLARKSDLQNAVDEEEQARAALDIARRELETLLQISFPAEQQQADMELANRQREQGSFDDVDRQRAIKHEASIKRLQSKLAARQQELDKAREHLELTTLRAPVTGIILYKRVSQGTEKRKPQVGDSLWNRHAFAVIPDLSSLVAYADIDEKDIGKVAVGQLTRIRPEAYRGMVLRGEVDAIGTLASDQNSGQAGRSFRVRIALEDIDERLRPGMSARASVLTGSWSDVTKVALEAVFYEGDVPVAFLREGGGHRRVELQLGESDGNFIVVNDGLQAGQQLSLVYPGQFDN
ncbi:MAG: hypothetical protein CME59_22300 [Halioglobus sp.]|nr:hypothetical protein [Halioglobus sp.]|tara:strand:+ start:2073 stop:3539 length:1467 start_codon:yes stop_codon:yes gene_type:complete